MTGPLILSIFPGIDLLGRALDQFTVASAHLRDGKWVHVVTRWNGDVTEGECHAAPIWAQSDERRPDGGGG